MIGNVFEYLANPSLGLYWLKGQNFVSAFVNINVCPPPVFGKIFTKSTDKNRVGPPTYIIEHGFEEKVSVIDQQCLMWLASFFSMEISGHYWTLSYFI